VERRTGVHCAEELAGEVPTRAAVCHDTDTFVPLLLIEYHWE
jgi:hypothetical protein